MFILIIVETKWSSAACDWWSRSQVVELEGKLDRKSRRVNQEERERVGTSGGRRGELTEEQTGQKWKVHFLLFVFRVSVFWLWRKINCDETIKQQQTQTSSNVFIFITSWTTFHNLPQQDFQLGDWFGWLKYFYVVYYIGQWIRSVKGEQESFV